MRPFVFILAGAVALASGGPPARAQQQQQRAPLPPSGSQPLSQADLDALVAPVTL